MKKMLLAALAAATLTTPIMTAPAAAQERGWRDNDRRDDRRDRNWRDERRGDDRRWNGDRRDWDPSRSYREGRYRERRLGRNDQIYRGRDGRAYCRRNDGTTGLVVGGVGGAVLGNLVGGGTLGTLLGGGAGALLGRSIDRGNVKCR